MRVGTVAFAGAQGRALDTDDTEQRYIRTAAIEELLQQLVRDAWQQQRAPHWVVFQNQHGQTNFEARPLQDQAVVADAHRSVARVELATGVRNVRALFLNRGLDVILPANQAPAPGAQQPQPAPAPAPGQRPDPVQEARRAFNDQTRWIRVPGVLGFFLLSAAVQAELRDQWSRLLRDANVGLDDAALNARCTPELRVLLGRHGDAVFPVVRTNRRGYIGGFTRPQRGSLPLPDVSGMVARTRNGQDQALTDAVRRRFELESYLVVISQQEGRTEAVNAYDFCAGVSLGPIQFNVTQGRLFQFLQGLWDDDRVLFNWALGAPLTWSVADHAAQPAVRGRGAVPRHPDLVVRALGPPPAQQPRPGRQPAPAQQQPQQHTLHGTRTDADREVNARFLQSGRVHPAHRQPNCARREVLRDVDLNYRATLTGHFRNAVAWPHIHPLVVETSVAYLDPGLTQINDAGIPALNLDRLDRDTFVLRSILMSAYVRYSGSIPPLVRGLTGTAVERLRQFEQRLRNAATFQAITSPRPLRLSPARSEEFRHRLQASARVARQRFDLVDGLARAARQWGAQQPAPGQPAPGQPAPGQPGLQIPRQPLVVPGRPPVP